MSDTNSLKNLDQTRGEAPTLSATDACGPILFECLGVGGMGEVYRCGDDALGRDLAIKILKAERRGDAAAEERFLREARLTGSLQHPGIVPIHQLGRTADGRPCYTMKLVRGRTLADLLRDEPAGPERLPCLLAVVEKVCQAVAFAHSRGVIHRDLKPSNVMVGEFGEVQVMDWGLAKELSRSEPETPELSRAGTALGTPAYMPPEQAAGEWDIVDERADVFALGSVLCEVLIGRPPHRGIERDEELGRARCGNVAEVLVRLEQCGADAALVDLCRACLAAERWQRPRHAGVVAERLAAYQAEVRERLRQAELERARAEVKTREERKRRRLRAALALAALLLLAGGVAAWWQWQRRRAEADGAVAAALGEARTLRRQAQAEPLPAVAYDKVLSSVRKAADMARAGGASEEMQRQADDLLAEVKQEAEETKKDQRLLARLLEAHGPREGPKYVRDDKGTLTALAEPTAEELFASAFRDWGLDVDATRTAEAAARLKGHLAAMGTEVIAALDEWASRRQLDRKPKAAARVADLAAALDDDPSSMRRELRAILAWGRSPLQADRTRLRQLAEQIDPAQEPVLGLLTLTRALRVAGEEALAERLLRKALTARPREVVLYHTLGDLLTAQQPPRWREAVEFYRAARGLRPDLGVTLATALWGSGREEEALDLLAVLVKERPGNPYLHCQQGDALLGKRDLDGAIACYNKALELDPKDAHAHSNLGNALLGKRDLDGAVARYKKALELDPTLAQPHNNLGTILCDHKHDYDGAIACFQRAIDLDPRHPQFHYNLGNALYAKQDVDGAIACYKKALELNPRYAPARYNLGNALRDKSDWNGVIAFYKKSLELDPKDAQAYGNLGNALYAKHDVDGAIACYKKSLELDPKDATSHYNLGIALAAKHDRDGAIACYQKAIELEPKYAEAHCNLGQILRQQGRFTEAVASLRRGHELGSNRPGWRYPSAEWLREAEHLAALDAKLPAVLTGEASPANSGEAVALAQMCQQYKRRYVAAARLYADAFALEPNLAADLIAQHRHNAACSAALATSGQGADTRLLPDKVAAMFRRWALGWLRDDLTVYAKLAEQNQPAVKQPIRQRLLHWRRDAGLASVRDPQALARLGDDERAAWQALWRDVDELATRLAKKTE